MSEQLETARARRDRIAAWREMLAAGRVAALDAALLVEWKLAQIECRSLEAVEAQLARALGPSLTVIEGGKGKGTKR